jgi:23S rRNA (cytidine1920-2'-O)/16S rRNA (cytidine1409-2'-O)-methyltransferase
MSKERLDVLLVRLGLAESREKAQALILAGAVTVDGRPSGKAGQAVSSEARIQVAAKLPYVSRAGKKLEAALDRFAIPVEGRVCLDVGASTGGFTDCLLQRGAARVHAVDVGVGQLDWKLRNDARVVLHEGVNARYLRFQDVGERVDLATCDVSFISVTLILPAVAPLLDAGGEMVVLVKPQFEVGRGQVGKGGIVREPALHEAAVAKVRDCLGGLGYRSEAMESPILGAEGNKEYLLYGRR